MFDQAFHAAQASRPNKDFRFRRNRHCCVAAIFDLEGEHSTEHRHLAPGDFMPGMGTQSRIMHALNLSMLGEKFRDFHRVFRMRPHPPRQRAHSAQNQPAIERRGDRAAGILDGANALEKIRSPSLRQQSRRLRRNARRNISWSNAELDRTPSRRDAVKSAPRYCRKRRARRRCERFRRPRQDRQLSAADWKGFQSRPALFAGRRAFFTSSRLLMSIKSASKSPAQENFTKQPCGAVVSINMRKDMVSRRERLKQGHRCRRATPKSRRSLAAFEQADAALERLTIRIVVARVHESARVRAFNVALEGGGKMNGRRNCPRCRINGVPGVDG